MTLPLSDRLRALAKELADDLYRDMHRYGSAPDVWPKKLEAVLMKVAADQRERDAPYMQHKPECVYWLRKNNPTLDSDLRNIGAELPATIY